MKWGSLRSFPLRADPQTDSPNNGYNGSADAAPKEKRPCRLFIHKALLRVRVVPPAPRLSLWNLMDFNADWQKFDVWSL